MTEVKGQVRDPLLWKRSHCSSFCLLVLCLFVYFLTSSTPRSVWCQIFGWRWQQWLADTEEEPLPQPPAACQRYFQSKRKPCHKPELQGHKRVRIWFYFAAVKYFFFNCMHTLRIQRHLLCLDCLIKFGPSVRVKVIIGFWWEPVRSENGLIKGIYVEDVSCEEFPYPILNFD